MNPELRKVKTKFNSLFGKKPVIVTSPGRINLIGEHTDYNDGFVLPAAIDKYIYFAIHPVDSNKCYLHSADFNDTVTVDSDDLKKSDKQWANYLIGILDQLKKAEHKFSGFECVFGGDIPIGSGLSSSAAIEAGLAYALNHLFGLGIKNIDLVKLSQKAENEFVGVRCGIMDQFINIYGIKNKVLKLDCRSLKYEYFPFADKDLKIVLCDTQVKHSLAVSEYNIRRKQCEEGVATLRKFNRKIKSLRDVNLEFLYEHKDDLNTIVFKRCEFVVKENERVEIACNDLSNNNFIDFGEMMFRSHKGLKNKYQVSCDELDLLVNAATGIDGVIGSRMMGGGFGGCTINLVLQDQLEDFKNKISEKYLARYGFPPKFYTIRITGGTSVMQ